MSIISIIQNGVIQAVKDLYRLEIAAKDVILGMTRREFEGDFTVTVFNIAKTARKAPPVVGQEMGDYLVQHIEAVSHFNIIQGFLNVSVSAAFWKTFVVDTVNNPNFGQLPNKQERVMVEFSSPNTNKPLHLGHIRNILLGWSSSKILEAAGYDVVRTKVVNDRGIAICKSMLAWQLFAHGETPETVVVQNPDGSTQQGIKGDHYVGDYYVLFEQKFKAEYKAWQTATALDEELLSILNKKNLPLDQFFAEYKNEYFNQHSALGAQARDLLLKWEAGDAETVALWQKMNDWVYQGFDETYRKLGVRFDKKYYESNTYMLGKDIIEENILRGVFYRKPDTSVWIDLTDSKLDHKLVLRSDGTSVYITQDIGMARLRDAEWQAQKVVYVVADEQNYHFQVLFEILKKLGEPYANGLYHLSYGMVELPTGKMKSREGTVVDADDLVAEVIAEAKRETDERGTLAQYDAVSKNEIVRRIGLAALKFQIVKVNPKKKMVFDPSESVQLEGNTGPYVQYAYVRTHGLVKDAETKGINLAASTTYSDLQTAEKELIQLLYSYEDAIEEAAKNYDPSVIANICYDVAKAYNKFWHDCPILREDLDTDTKTFRVQLSKLTGHVLKHGFDLLGIEMPDRM
jgi:arginyl-tRNA synthetase